MARIFKMHISVNPQSTLQETRRIWVRWYLHGWFIGFCDVFNHTIYDVFLFVGISKQK